MVFVERKKKKWKPAKPKAERTRAEREASATSRDVALQFEAREAGVKQGKIDTGTPATPEEIKAWEAEKLTPKVESEDVRGKILKTESGKWRTDIKGQFEQATGEKVAAQPVPIGIGGYDLAGVGANVPKVLQTVAAHPVASTLTAVYLANKIAEGNLNVVWAAVDNIATGTAFSIKKTREAFESGAIDIVEAERQIAEIQEMVDYSDTFVHQSLKLNPYLWFGLGKPYSIAIKKAQEDIAKEREIILALDIQQIQQQEEFFDITQKEKIEKEKLKGGN